MFALFFINFAFRASILSLMLPLSALFYGMLESPSPSHKYWNAVTGYILVVLALKLTYQIPIFCSSGPFQITNCNEIYVDPAVLVNRIDYVIGLQKFTGPASYPSE